MEKYFFRTRGHYDCVERCMVHDDGTMIGSAKCQQCEFHKEDNQDEFGDISWIKCEKINEAIKTR